MAHEAETFRVAIACQGGGSHTAFTAGVLQTVLQDPRVEIRAMSGTSGGAVCAVCAWSGLVGRRPEASREEAVERLGRLWKANTTPWWLLGVEIATLAGMRISGDLGWSPEFSAYANPLDPRQNFLDLLEQVVPFDTLTPGRLSPHDPRLLISAADVLTGEFRVFRSHRLHGYDPDRIGSSVILASAALPTVFRAVELCGGTYWDGGFTQNPPIRELVPAARRDVPDEWPDGEGEGEAGADGEGSAAGRAPEPVELWIVQVNPESRLREPTSMDDIRDRRNELTGNISFQQEVHAVGLVNDLLQRGLLAPRALHRYGQVKVRVVAMDPRFAQSLDYESKMERDSGFIRGLMAHGRVQAAQFLRAVHAHDDDRTALPGRDVWGRWNRPYAPCT